MIDAVHASIETVRTAYDRRSGLYARTVAPLEAGNHVVALEAAAIQPHEAVLEVAVGPGLTLVDILRHVDSDTVVHGVDLSPRMLDHARHRAQEAGFTNVDLREADARTLPFADGAFDLLYNAYMLDLIPTADFDAVLNEFRRVLRPGGRLVLLNMSKERDGELTVRERLYRRLPPRVALYLVGGCRPVLMEQAVERAGFREVVRRYLTGAFPSELVLARR